MVYCIAYHTKDFPTNHLVAIHYTKASQHSFEAAFIVHRHHAIMCVEAYISQKCAIKLKTFFISQRVQVAANQMYI